MIAFIVLLAKLVCPNSGHIERKIIVPVPSKDTKISFINESFENWPPTTFTLSPATGDGSWRQSPVNSANYISPQTGASGEYAAEFDSWDYSSGVHGDMISEPIDLSISTSPMLRFYFWNHSDSTGYGNSDYLLVHISTDGDTSWTLIDSLYGDVDTWTLHSYDLSAYVGDTVTVRFRGVSDYGGSNMAIDGVALGQIPDYDAALIRIISPVSYDSVHARVPQVVVSSEGLMELQNFYVYAEARHNSSIVYLDSVFISSLPSGSIDTVNLITFNPDSGFFYDFLFYTAYPGDGFTTNDSASVRTRFYYTNRTVVGELITNTGCSPCEPANDTLDQIFPDYPDKLALIRYHAWWPSTSDPFYQYNISENTGRINYYGADYAPHFHIDGIVDGGSNRNAWHTMLTEEMNKKACAKIDLSGSYDNVMSQGQLHAIVRFTGEPTDTILYLRAALIENGIRYNAPNGQTVFYQVFRKMFPDTGSILVIFNSIGQSVDCPVPFEIDTTLNEDSLAFVVFLQSDDSKEILQGSKVALSALTGLKENSSRENIFKLHGITAIVRKNLIMNFVAVGKKNIRVTVFDAQGRTLIKREFNGIKKGSNSLSIGLNKFTDGVYFIKLEYGGKSIIRNFIVEH